MPSRSRPARLRMPTTGRVAPKAQRPGYADDRYTKQRRVGFPWLRFWADIEREFRESHFVRHRSRIRLASGAGLFGICGILVPAQALGLNLLDDIPHPLLFGVTVPALLVLFAASYARRATGALQAVVYWANLAVAWSLACVIYLSNRHNLPFPYEALVLLTMYVFFLSGLLFYQALFCSAVIAAGYVVAQFWPGGRGAGSGYEFLVLLLSNLIGWIGLHALEREDRSAFLLHHELSQQAQLDSLTGVMNRRAFRIHLETAWRQARREGVPIGIALVDLDFFKSINDRHGHLFGDSVLKRVAQVLRTNAARPLDAVGRYGGDEFIVLWYDPDPEWFRRIAQLLPSHLGRMVYEDDSASPPVTMSGGAVLVWPGPELAMNDVVRTADDKLYEIKRGGRNGIAFVTMGEPKKQVKATVA